jgi:Holliday junction resolvase RusA-like endonuclease
MTDIIATGTVLGNLPSLKNRRRLIPGKGNRKPMIIRSSEALAYEQMFLMTVPKKMRNLYDGPVSVKVRVHYQSRRSDLSTELLFDLLQKAEIIKNDNQIMHVESWKGLDRDNPRIHYSVTKWEKEDA